MAKLTATGFEELEAAMLRRSQAAEKAIPAMLKAGGEVMKQAFQAETKKLDSTGRSTGDLTASIKVSAVKERDGARFVEVAPTGKDRHGVRNAEKGFVLNYGRSNMQARPWFTRTVEATSDKAMEAMRREWEAMQSEV